MSLAFCLFIMIRWWNGMNSKTLKYIGIMSKCCFIDTCVNWNYDFWFIWSFQLLFTLVTSNAFHRMSLWRNLRRKQWKNRTEQPMHALYMCNSFCILFAAYRFNESLLAYSEMRDSVVLLSYFLNNVHTLLQSNGGYNTLNSQKYSDDMCRREKSENPTHIIK